MEANAIGFGIAEILMFLLGGQFLGLVPGERDPQLIKSPPGNVCFYQEWTSAGPGASGAPGIDGFVADPEIEAFVRALEKSLRDPERDDASFVSDLSAAASQELPMLLLLAARHAGAIYVADSSPNRDESVLPTLEAAVVLTLEDDLDEFVLRLNRVLEMIPGYVPNANPDKLVIPLPGKPLLLHRAGGRLVLTTGRAAWDRLSRRWEQPEAELSHLPKFQAAREKLTVERLGGLTWFNGELLHREAQQLGPAGVVIKSVAKSLGLGEIESVLTVTGIEQHDQISRTRVAVTGPRAGLLKLFDGRPLAAADLAHIPADADFVAAFSLPLGTLREIVHDVVGRTLPEAIDGVKEFQRQLEQELQLQFDDLAQGFGDVWTVYDAPSNGGLIAAGLVAAVPVKDAAKARQVVTRWQDLLIESLPLSEGDGQKTLEEFEFRGERIRYWGWSGYAEGGAAHSAGSPAFCLTKTHFLFALHPQALKAHLRFLESNEPRFDAAKLKSAGGRDLVSAIYVDTPAVGRIVYPLVPYLLKSPIGEWRQEGGAVGLDLIPSTRAVQPYLRETTWSVTRSPSEIVFEQRNVLPVFLAAMLLPRLPWGEDGMQDGEFLLGGTAQPADEAPAVSLGTPEGGVVQAKSEEPPKPEVREPTAIEKAARRSLPYFVKGLLPDQVEAFIPPGVLEQLGEFPDPEKAAERAARRERRRQERAKRREQRLAP